MLYLGVEMFYSIKEDMNLIHIQDRIDKLLVTLKDHLKDASPNQIMHIKRELNQLITSRLSEINSK